MGTPMREKYVDFSHPFMEVGITTVYTNSNMEGIERVREEAGSYAYFIESPMAEYITSRTCDLAMLGRNLDSKYYGLIVKKDSSYRKDLNVALLSLMEKGILSQLKSKWWDYMDGGGSCPKGSWYDDQTERTWIQTLFDFLPEF